MRDYNDGVAFKSLGKNSDTYIRLHFYSNELEICNALGSKKGTHKILVFYFIVENIETKNWINLAHIHLALVANYSVFKRYGYKKVLQCLIDDVKIL